MRRRPVGLDDLPEQIPSNCREIVVTNNRTKLTIRTTNAGRAPQTSIEAKQELLMKRVSAFFADEVHFAALLPLLEQTAVVSLRLLDYLVTNFAKKTPVYLDVCRHGRLETVDLFLDYKAQLKAFSKRSFDPFCRRERVLWVCESDPQRRQFLTTPAQLNFFRWCIEMRLCEWVQEHNAEVERDMVQNLRVRDEDDPGRRRRVQISPAATATLSCSCVDHRLCIE